MTTLAVLADIHGNLPALDAVLADLAGYGVDQVVVAGDVVNWGPFSAAVLGRVAAAGWPVIRGNHELYLLDYQTPRAPAAWQDRQRFSLLPWLRRQLAGAWPDVVATWPETLTLRYPAAPPLLVVHGSPRSPWEPLSPAASDEELTAILTGVPGGTVIAGHIHLPVDRVVGPWHIVNPGPVGVPLDGVFSASYLLLESAPDGWRPTFRRVPFDYAPLFAEFARQRFTEECGLIGHLVVEEFRTARLQIQPFLRWHAACHPGAPLTPDLLEPFLAVDPWAYIEPVYHRNRHLPATRLG